MLIENEPLVSVIVNCFNGERFLKASMDSILSQTYRNWEVIFWDNQSTDQSANIFNSYGDDRLKYHYAPSHTLIYEARNYAVEQSSGDYIAFLDVDDWWAPEKLTKQVPLFDDPEVGFVCCKSWLLIESSGLRKQINKNAIPTGRVLRELVEGYFLIISSLVIRKSAFYSMGEGFDKSLHILGDMDFMIQMAVNWKLDCYQQELMFYRLHGDNIGQTQRELHAKELKVIVEKFKNNDDINQLTEFNSLKNELVYIQGQQHISKKQRIKSLSNISHLPLGNLKIKLVLLFIFPRALLRLLRLVQ